MQNKEPICGEECMILSSHRPQWPLGKEMDRLALGPSLLSNGD